MILRWRIPPPPLELRWRGPRGMAEAIKRSGTTDIAGFLVPPADINGIVATAPGLVIVGDEVRLNIGELPIAPEN